METLPEASNANALAHDAEPLFRVVEGGGARRGIRLERLYWQVLREITQANQKKLGAAVLSVLDQARNPGNATSLLRVYCLRWLIDALASARELSNPAHATSLIRACPGAAFAIGVDKRIVAYNQSFLNFVQARISYSQPDTASRDLRLTLDGQLTDLAAALKTNGNTPVEVGFVVGFGERRLRGKLNAVLAPVWGQNIMLCYVLT